MSVLERDTAVATTLEYLRDAAHGHGRLLLVCGEAGIGKTTYAREVRRRATGQAAIAWGSCDGTSTPAPLAPLAEMLDDLPAGVWPDRDDPGPRVRADIFRRLTDVLRDPAGPQPYLLVVEDLHWADEATLDLVRHLSRRIHDCRALVLVTYRPEEARASAALRTALGDAATHSGVRRLDLSPLSLRAVRELAAETDGVRSLDVDQLYDLTGGNAFFVTEVLAAPGDSLPRNVSEAVAARVQRLPADTRQALDVLAVAGARTDLTVVEELLGDGAATLDPAAERGIVVIGPDGVQFRHELARLCVADEVPALRRVSLHRAVLRVLRDRLAAGDPVDLALLAHHAEGAADASAVLELAPRAAAQAAALGAHREAAEQYRRAVHFGGSLSAADLAELLGRLAYECYLTDQTAAAWEARTRQLELAAELGDRLQIGTCHRWLSRLAWFLGDNVRAVDHAAEAVAALEAALAEAVDEPAPAVRSALGLAYSNRAQLCMLAGDRGGTRHWVSLARAQAVALPEGADRTEILVHAANNLGTAELLAGDVDEGEPLLRESLAEAVSADLHEHAARAYCNLASSAVTQHRHEVARQVLDEGIRYTADRDLDAWAYYLLGWRAQHLLDVGDHERAERVALDVLRRPDVAAVSQITPLAALARARARRGEGDWATPLERARTLAAGTREAQRLAVVAVAGSEIAWISGADPAAPSVEAWPVVTTVDDPWLLGAVAAWITPPPDGAARRVAGPYRDLTEGRWLEAADQWQALDSPFDAALALARSGSPDALDRSLRQLEELAADGPAERVRTLLRRMGRAPRPARGPARPGGLTAREAEVAGLAVQGLTDADIAEQLVLSRRTVEHHVASVLRKLAIGTRRDIGAALAEMGTDGPSDR